MALTLANPGLVPVCCQQTSCLSPQELGHLSESEGHAMRLLDYGPAAKERARALLRKVHLPTVTACRSRAECHARILVHHGRDG